MKSKGLVIFGVLGVIASALGIFGASGMLPQSESYGARSGSSVVLLPDGLVFIAGGSDSRGPVNAAELFKDGSFVSARAMSIPRANAAAVMMQDGRVLVTGGTSAESGILNSAEIYNPSSNSWEQVASSLIERRSAHTASLLPDGRIVLVGGLTDGRVSQSVEIYNPATNVFSFAGNMSAPRSGHAAAVLADGRVMIVGGSFNGVAPSDTTDIFNPESGAVVSGPSLNRGRTGHTATTLADGRVLIAGGNDGLTDLDSVEIYDPAAESFTLTGSLRYARNGHAAFLLSTGDVLIVGGANAAPEIYRVGSGTFEEAPTDLHSLSPEIRTRKAPLASRDVLPPSITTDKDKYHPGETMIIRGSGFQGGENVRVQVFQGELKNPANTLLQTHTVAANLSGSFTDSYTFPANSAPGTYNIKATGLTSGLVATERIVDPPFSNGWNFHWSQCQNDPSNTDTKQNCDWTTGGLNGNNSVLHEDDVVPHRMLLDGPQAGQTYVLRIQYQFTKGNKYAYDFLARPDYTQSGTLLQQCKGSAFPSGWTEAACDTLFGGKLEAFIPSDPFDNDFKKEFGYVSNGVPVNNNPDRKIWMGGVDQLSVATVPHDPASSACVATTSCGDTDAFIDVTFRATGSKVVLWLGAHIASGADPDGSTTLREGWGIGNGASTITGSPYHVILDQISHGADTDSIGQRDNQMQGSAVVLPPDLPVVTTAIHNGSNHSTDVQSTTIALGSTIHDQATVSNVGGNNGTPQGTATFQFFSNGTCANTATATSSALTLVSGVVDATGFAQGPLSVGSYSFKASYTSSDPTKWSNAVGACEPVTVGKATPTLTTEMHSGTGTGEGAATVVSEGGSVTLGTVMHDKATLGTLISGVNPTGSVTFRFYTTQSACTNDTDFTGGSVLGSTVSLTASAPFNAHPSADTSALTTGSYAFKAQYGGDPNYNAATSACENFSVGKATPTLTTEMHSGTGTGEGAATVVSEGGSVTLGTVMHDKATLGTLISGVNPTGSVTFRFYSTQAACTSDSDFTGGSVLGSTVSLTASAPFNAHPSADTSALTTGSYSFKAQYGGDPNYNAATSACENFSVGKATPTLTTEMHSGTGTGEGAATVVSEGGSVTLGTVMHDKATLGTLISGVNPTGSVTFRFYSTQAACTSDADFTGGSVLGSTVSLTASAPFNAHPSADTSALTTGSYSFKAQYGGDPNYNAATSACENFSIGKANPTLTTEMHSGTGTGEGAATVVSEGGSVALGTVMHDKATLGTLISGVNPTGSVTFRFYSTQAACTSDSNFSGGSVLGSPVTLTASAPFNAHPSADTSALGAGSYSFKAQYGGDPNYNAATSACENFTVNRANTSTSTELHNGSGADSGGVSILANNGNATGTTVHDKASVSGQVGSFAISGNVTFKFYTTQAACTADTTAAAGTDKGTVTLSSGIAHPSTDAASLTAGNYAFRAKYNGDSNYNSSVSACEPFYLTTLKITKRVQGTGTATFSFDVTGANTLNAGTTPSTSITPPAGGSASVGPVIITPGGSVIAEHTPIPAGYTLTDATCVDANSVSGGSITPGTLDSNGVPVNIAFTAAQGSKIECSYINNNAQATRTQGFWATHTLLANRVWGGNGTTPPPGVTPVSGSGDDVFSGPACTTFTITALTGPAQNLMMGGFWSNISQKYSKGGKRSSIDQARMQMIQQYLAAALNNHMFGSGSSAMLAAARAAYCGTNEGAIQAQVGILGSFNEAGDGLGSTPGGSATTQASKAQADIDAWDTPTNVHN